MNALAKQQADLAKNLPDGKSINFQLLEAKMCDQYKWFKSTN
jgi:hypothetical protein